MSDSGDPVASVASRRTETADIARLASGAVLFIPRQGVRIGLDQAKENNRVISELAAEGPILVVAQIEGIVHMDLEARRYSAKYAEHHYAKVALVVTNPMSRMLASFFLGLNKPAVPTRMFGDQASATAWLLEESPPTPG